MMQADAGFHDLTSGFVGADPDSINEVQLKKLKSFKSRTYPKGLVEHYKSHLEFLDKFSRQLELMVRKLQESASTGALPLSLQFVSVPDGDLVGSVRDERIDLPVVTNYGIVPDAQREEVVRWVSAQIRDINRMPLALALVNSGASSIRDAYLEMVISSSSDKTEIADSLERSPIYTQNVYGAFTVGAFFETRPEMQRRAEAALSRLDDGHLKKRDEVWCIAMALDTLQPNRVHGIRPALY